MVDNSGLGSIRNMLPGINILTAVQPLNFLNLNLLFFFKLPVREGPCSLRLSQQGLHIRNTTCIAQLLIFSPTTHADLTSKTRYSEPCSGPGFWISKPTALTSVLFLTVISLEAFKYFRVPASAATNYTYR